MRARYWQPLALAILTASSVANAQISGWTGRGGGTVGIANGGTTETQSTEDAVLVGAGTTDWQAKVLVDCDSTNSAVNYDTTTNEFTCRAISSFPAGITVTQSTSNGRAVTATGNGTGEGGQFTGGATNATGVQGLGGGTTGTGVYGQGGSANGTGVFGLGTGGNPGVDGQGGATGHGIKGTGGASDGFGGLFQGGATNGRGLTSVGAGTGVGVHTTGGTGANGINAFGGGGGATAGIEATGGPGGSGAYFNNGTAATAAARQDAAVLSNGDLNLAGVANPNSDVAVTNRLTPNNMAKVHGLLTITGGAGGGNFSIAVTAGFNITSVARTTATSFTITYASNFAAATYTFVSNTDGTDAIQRTDVTTRNVGSAVAAVRNAAGTALDMDAHTGTITVDFVIHGAQ